MPSLKDYQQRNCYTTFGEKTEEGLKFIIEMDPEYPKQVGYVFAFFGTGFKHTSAIGFIAMEMLKGNKDYKSMF